MYAIYSNGVMLSITDSPRYVRLNESSGAYVEAAPDEAVGIAVSGTLYNLPGSTAIEGAPEAVVTEDELEGLKAITKYPSEILQIADRKGELREGLDADIVIWSKHPFDYDSNVERVFIEGEDMLSSKG